METLLKWLSRLPLWMLYRLSDVLAPIIYHLVRYRRHVVEDNINRCFPDRSPAERRRIVKRFYCFFCDYAVETVKLLTISEAEMHRRMTFVGVERMDAALENHPFTFLMVGHYGNWEWLSTFARWSPHHCEQLYTPLHNRTMDRIFLKMRSRFGTMCVAKYDVLRQLISQRQQGIPTHVGFIADQSPRPHNIHHWVQFLHRRTPVFTGAERLGKKLNAAAFFAHVERPRRGYYVCHIEPLAASIADYTDYEFTDLYMRRLEQEISEQPHLWLWSHKRWKYANEAPEA